LNEAYELFGCGTDELYTIAVSGYGYDTDDNLATYWAQHDLTFRGISQEGGSGAIVSTYGIGAYPTYILIAPNHDIVEQDMWPISNTQTFVTHFQNNGLTQSTCEPLDAIFEADEDEVCEGNTVNFTDISEGVPITWEWTFEGGTPATSTEENPSVTYDTFGSYDVTLTVHDGVATTNTEMVDYIAVSTYPNTTLDPFDMACVNWIELELTGGSPEGGVYSGDFVEDGIFHPAEAGIGEHVIVYSYTNEAGCEATAEETILVDPCTGIREISDNSIKIFPNPAEDMVNLTSVSTIVNIQIINTLGQVVIETNVNGKSYQLNTSDLESGLYLVRLETENNFILKQLVIK